MRKVIVLFAIVFGLALCINLPLFEDEITFKSKEQAALEQEDALTRGEPIGVDEINSFLAVWPEYKNSWAARFDNRPLSFTTAENMGDSASYPTKIWLARKGWAADRFFYVEQRLRAIVGSLRTEEMAKNTIDVLEAQLKEETDEDRIASMQKVIGEQKELYNIERVSRQERDVVRPHLHEIMEILQ